MPLAPEQLAADVDFLTQQPAWQDEKTRGDFIRSIAIGQGTDTTPEERRAVAGELWKRADTRRWDAKAVDFTERAVGEVVKSIPAGGAALAFAASDAVGATDTGSGTRLARGVANLGASIAQRTKKLMPGESNQAKRDAALEALKADLDEGAHPPGFEDWLAGGEVADDDTRAWVEGLTSGFARQAVAADYMGEVDPEKVRAYLESDRNPAMPGNEFGPGPREFLADYVATRDPASWEAFKSRVTETDSQYTTRLRNFAAGAGMRAVMQGETGMQAEMVGRMADMQGSPIDLASAALPLLRGGKVLQAAKAGGMAAATGRVLAGAGKEAAQEGLTEALQDPRASTAQVLEAAAMGAVGSGVLEGGMAGAGALMRDRPLAVPSPAGRDALPRVPDAAPEATDATQRVPTTLAAIAQRGGTVSIPGLEEHTGDLTPEEVADLDAAGRDALPRVPDPAPTPEAIPTPEPSPSPTTTDATQRVPTTPLPDPTGQTPKTPPTITGSNVQTGTEMPVPPPSAAADAGAGGATPSAGRDALPRVPDPAPTPEAIPVPQPPPSPTTTDATQRVPTMPVPPPSVAADATSFAEMDDATLAARRAEYAPLVAEMEAEQKANAEKVKRAKKDYGSHPLEKRNAELAAAIHRIYVDGGFQAMQMEINRRAAIKNAADREVRNREMDARMEAERPARQAAAEERRRAQEAFARLTAAKPGDKVPNGEGVMHEVVAIGQRAAVARKAEADGRGVTMMDFTDAQGRRKAVAFIKVPEAQQTQGFTHLNPAARTGGYLNGELIAEGIDLIRQGLTDFAAWSRAMLQRFGDTIRTALRTLWQAAQDEMRMMTTNKGSVANPFAGNPFHRGRSFRVSNPNVRTLLTGSVLPTELRKVVTASEHEITAMTNAAAALGRDLDLAMQAHAKATGQTEQVINDRVNAALEGTLPIGLVGLPPLQEAVRRARNMLDDLSQAVGNYTGGNLGSTIMANLGTWMRRSYAAFDPDANWNYDALTKAAAKGASVAGVPAAQILNNARAFLQHARPTATAAEITADMRGLMDRAIWEDVMTGGTPAGVRKDVTSLMRRRDIPQPIRALMGEERNPVKRFLGSTRFQSQYIARHEMQMRMRDMGLVSGLFSTTRENEYTEPLGEGGDRGKSGFALNGQPIYTTPELKAALAFAPGAIAPTDVGSAFLKAIYYIGGQAKLNKVALSMDSWVVNLLGNLTGLVQTGNFLSPSTFLRMRRAIELLRSGKAQALTAGAAAVRDHLRAVMARITASGVADSSLNAALVEDGLNTRLVQFIEKTEGMNILAGAVKGAITGQAMGAAFGATGRAIGGAAGALAGGALGNKRVNAMQAAVAKWAMQNPDRWGKIVEFLDNYEAGLAAGLSDQAAFDLATEKTINTMPDYSKLPALLRGGSRLGVFGSFIAFQYEVYRNAFHNARYAVQEIRSGNGALMTKGARRLMGQSAVLALAAGGLQAILGNDTGDEGEKDEAWRRALGRPWEKFSKLAYRQLDGERASFYNTSYLLPQSTMLEIWEAGASGADFDESMENIWDAFNRQFLETGIHIDPLLSAVRNQTKDGRKVSNEEGAMNYAERLAYALAPMVPGTADKFERVMRSKEVLNRPRWDREFSLEEEGLRALGVRSSTYTHERRMSGKVREFHERKRAITDAVKSIYGETGRAKTDQWGKEKQQQAAVRANQRLAELRGEWEQFEKDLGTLGIPSSKLRAVQRDSGGRLNWNEIKIGKDGPTQTPLR